jgi:hypothetical protein
MYKTIINSIVLSLSLFSLLLAPTIFTHAAITADVCGTENCILGFENVDLNSLDKDGIVKLILSIATYVVFVLGAVAVLAIIWGAILLIFNKGELGWSTIKNALLGLVIAILSFSIVNLIVQLLSGNIVI